MRDNLVIFMEELYNIVDGKAYGNANWLIYALEIAKHFDQAALFLPAQVLPSTDADPGYYVTDLTASQARIIMLPPYDSLASSIARLPRVMVQFLRYVQQSSEVQAVLIRTPTICGLALAELSRILGKQVFFYVGGNVETAAAPVIQGGLWQPGWRKVAQLINGLLRFSARGLVVFAVGREMTEKFGKKLPFIPQPLEIINVPNPMYGSNWLYPRLDSYAGGMVKLLRVGQLVPTKGLEILLQSVAILIRKGLPVQLEIAGDGDQDYYQSLLNLTAKLGLSPYVKFLGTMDHKRIMGLYRQAHIQVVSSLGEGVPRVIMEGWAASLPLVTTAVGGIPGIVRHESNGLLVPPGDAAALAAAIERIISDGELRRRLIRHGFACARENSREKQAQQIAEIIKRYCSP
jgi:glycosyltransferase involved in cell wall biosynthesis